MKKTILAAAAVSLLGSLYSQAQSVVTDPVGFVSVSIPAASDASLGTPLGRANEFQGVIQSISATTGTAVVTVAGTPGWTASQFVYASGTQAKTYYARIDSGVREGLIATITANDANSITLTVPTGDDLVGVLTNAANGTGDSVSIAPYWTLGTLITGVPAGTQILIYPTNVGGINLSASTIYFSNGTSWFQGATNSDDTILPPLQGFTLRNNSAGTVTVSITGSVPMATNRLVVRTLVASKQQDQRIFFNSPVPEYVGNSGLGTTAGDQLLVFDNSATGKNKSANVILVWTGTKWLNSGVDVSSTFQLQPGTSYVLRKAPSASPGTTVTSHLQSYLQ
jgi:uncharacterized protein (TIGR02597 family)